MAKPNFNNNLQNDDLNDDMLTDKNTQTPNDDTDQNGDNSNPDLIDDNQTDDADKHKQTQKKSFDSNEQNIQEYINSNIKVPDQVTVQLENPDKLTSEIKEMNDAFGIARKIYEEVLSPELTENEKLKRQHKDKLMVEIFKILKLQFIFTYLFVLCLIAATIFSNTLSISDVTIKNIISFIEIYITSIIVELISILFFIVQSVFDKSIVDLIKDFDKRNE